VAEFIKVASISELAAGSCKTVEVDGKVYALDNTCLHQGGPLGEGSLEGEVGTCPWHFWEFNVRTGEKVGDPSLRVASYPVQIEGDDIKVAV
jgi:nitrite reductase (NADH) small subunit